MTILDPNYPLYAAQQASMIFENTLRDIEKDDTAYKLQAKKSKAIGKQLNRRFLLQKIFYNLRINNG